MSSHISVCGRTTIVITHRLELVRQTDRIVMHYGARIVDDGSTGELSGREGSFAELFAIRPAPSEMIRVIRRHGDADAGIPPV